MAVSLSVFAAFFSACGAIVAVIGPGQRWAKRCFKNSRFVIGSWVSGCLLLLVCSIGLASTQWRSEAWGSAAIVTAVFLVAHCITVSLLQRQPALNEHPRRILAVGAHPDDVELACGATIAKLVDAGHDVRIMVMSQGESGGNASLRTKEAERGAAYLGANISGVHGFCDTRLSEDSNAMIAQIEKEITEFAPDAVLTHSKTDVHQDHEAVHHAVMRAGRKLPTILCFESPSVGHDFNPRFFVNIDGYTETKIEAIKIHNNQKTKPYMTRERVIAMANFRGTQVKRGSAEGFEVVRMMSNTVGDF